MNEITAPIQLYEVMHVDEGWGREQGHVIQQKLVTIVENTPKASIFRISLERVIRVDVSFASETIVELARRYRTKQGFCFLDMPSVNQKENWIAAALNKEQPLMLWEDELAILGPSPSVGLKTAFDFAVEHGCVRASEFSKLTDISIASASSKFKELWQKGFLLRQEGVQKSGGVEFEYFIIK